MTIDKSWYQKPDGVPGRTAAGGVVVRQEGARLFVALAQEKGHSGYVLPKGHVDPGESVEEAARREIEEEVGVTDLRLVEPLGARERLSYDKREWKTTYYFLYLTRQVEAVPTHREQHDVMGWFPLERLPRIIWPEQIALLEENRRRIAAAIDKMA